MRVKIYIGTDKVDLFADENIEVNSSVADINDITKNTTDYTKTFTVPASKENNKLFKHYYNANVDNSFDARIKVSGRIELDGILFRVGKFRLHKVAIKKGKPSSYTINFWGNLTSLKDILGKDELRDLDLSAFDHSYDSATVKTGLTSSLFSGDMVYSLLAKKQYYYNSDVLDTFTSDALTNIGYGNGSGSNGVEWNDLRPSIKVIKIIEAIESDYNISFSRDFFGRTEFTELFLWLNNTKDKELGGDAKTIDWDGGSSAKINHSTNIGLYDVSNTSASNDNYTWELENTITPSSGYENVFYTVKLLIDDTVEFEEETRREKTFRQSLKVSNAPNNPHQYSLKWEIQSGQEFKYTASIRQIEVKSGTVIAEYVTTASQNTIESETVISNTIPKIKIIDFLKGLFKAFKLVVISENDGTLYVNTLNSFYSDGSIYDVTNYINFESYDVSRGKILNEINFLFSEPKTILNIEFEKNNRIAYGDAEIKLTDDNDDLLDGEKLEFTLPFEQILYERLLDTNTDNKTNIQYGAVVDEEISPVNPKPVLHYNVLQSLNGDTVGFINETEVKSSISTFINLPSHTLGFDDPSFSTIFDAEFSTWNGQKINNTLYKNYHEDYILSIFNVRKREYNYTAKNMPLRIMLDLQLNDLLKIKDTFYRINNFTTNLLTGDVKLNLVNSFTNNINSFSATPANFFVDEVAQQVSTYITNLDSFSYNKVDQGSGVAWVTVTSSGNNMFFDLTENDTGDTRDILIDVTNLDTLQVTQIYINQTGVFLPSFKFNDIRNSQNIILL